MKYIAIRYHDISAGHRVLGHTTPDGLPGQCARLHGHNYRFHLHCVTIDSTLNQLGMVVDFGVIKSQLCVWLDKNWDHKFLIYREDPFVSKLLELEPDSLVILNFNPTAENLGAYLINTVGPLTLKNSGVVLVKVIVEETRKCSALVELSV